MTVSTETTLPVLSMTGSDKAQFAQDFGDSFARYGFAMVSDHGMDQALIDRCWELTRELFDQPEEVKRRYHRTGGGGARGYTPFGLEIAKDAKKNDLKEFWHVGRDLPEGHRFSDQMAPNVWPEHPAAFEPAFKQLFAEFDKVGARLLSAIAVYLGLEPDWFDAPTRDGNSVLRLLHYPPVSQDAEGLRAAPHEDINLITLLLGAEEAGLEIKGKDGGWISVDPPKDALVVNVGDMLQRLANHRLPSTTHRVNNPAAHRRGHSRYSMPFFLHLAPDFEIKTLPQCVDAAHPDQYPEPISAHDYLQQRLYEIGLLKK